MFSEKGKSILILLLISLFVTPIFAQETKEQQDEEVLKNSIELLKTYFSKDKNWQVIEPEIGKNVDGLINFIEDQPLDDIIKQLNNAKLTQGDYVQRLPENVSDSLTVPGYVSAEMLQQEIEKIELDYKNEVKLHEIMVPTSVIEQAESEVVIIPEGKGFQLFVDSTYSFPDSLIIPDVIPDSVLNSPEQFNRLVRIDSIRNVFIEKKRQLYNDSVKTVHINAMVRQYRQDRYEEGLDFRIKRHKDFVKSSNNQILTEYNNRIVAEVNDTIKAVIDVLAAYADFTDTTRISLVNIKGESEDILLQNGNERFSRVWLKNEQDDSLRVMVKNLDKRSIHLLIDDGVTFSRFKEKQTKNFDFETLKGDYGKFSTVGKSYELETPWRIGGDGNAGFTQTYLENWKKGGKSSLALLIVLNGFANYSRKDGKVKWENSGEIRTGWIRSGGDEELQKNDDKFEITSRYGVSAFKKWYYSAELNVNTQLYRGYNYPKSENPDPISTFMAPLRTYFKVGLDYKPSSNMSVFLSPLTLKNIYVRDTTLIDQTRYGVGVNSKSFWEPGLNAELSYKKAITENISYQTKYKMFINYQDPFRKFDINWENLFKMQLNNYIGMQFMLHFIYDDDVLFPVYDDNEVKIGEEPKLQIKEFFSIGFTYKINKKVMRTHRIR